MIYFGEETGGEWRKSMLSPSFRSWTSSSSSSFDFGSLSSSSSHSSSLLVCSHSSTDPHPPSLLCLSVCFLSFSFSSLSSHSLIPFGSFLQSYHFGSHGPCFPLLSFGFLLSFPFFLPLPFLFLFSCYRFKFLLTSTSLLSRHHPTFRCPFALVCFSFPLLFLLRHRFLVPL